MLYYHFSFQVEKRFQTVFNILKWKIVKTFTIYFYSSRSVCLYPLKFLGYLPSDILELDLSNVWGFVSLHTFLAWADTSEASQLFLSYGWKLPDRRATWVLLLSCFILLFIVCKSDKLLFWFSFWGKLGRFGWWLGWFVMQLILHIWGTNFGRD